MGDYRLLSSRAVESLKSLSEQHRFMKGLFTWIGYEQKSVPTFLLVANVEISKLSNARKKDEQ